MSDPGSWSVGVVRALSRLPVWLVFVAVLGLTVGGLIASGVLAAVLLGVVAVVLAALAAVQWRTLLPVQRLVRAGAAVVVAVVAVVKLVA